MRLSTSAQKIGQKRALLVVLAVYILSYFLQSLLFSPSFAGIEAPTDNKKLIAVFVDRALRSDPETKADIERYTTSYLQQKSENTTSVIYPIDVTKYKARDIAQILQNMYLDGVKNESSNLIGTILIGNIPLPVVKKDSFMFPSIFPYVDFKDPEYVYNPTTHFFEYNNHPNGQAEIWHSLITFGSGTAVLTPYYDYFNKLKSYAKAPSEFVGSGVWYEDMVDLQKTVLPDVAKAYVDNFLFTEDTSYYRYSNVLVDWFNQQWNQGTNTVQTDLSSDIADLKNSDADISEQATLDQYATSMTNLQAMFAGPATPAADIHGIPAFTLKPTVDAFLKSYTDVYGPNYMSRMKDNLMAGGRRQLGDIDFQARMIALRDDLVLRNLNKDDQTKNILQDFNDTLFDSLNQQIDSGHYAMHIVIPTNYTEYTNKLLNSSYHLLNFNCTNDRYNVYQYESYYFGRNANLITGAMDTSIYRGRYQNFTSTDDLTDFDYTAQYKNAGIANPALRSVGASYGIADKQIEANRGYDNGNSDLISADAQKLADGMAGKIDPRCTDTDPAQFMDEFRWGNTPLNLTSANSVVPTASASDLLLARSNFDYARNPSFNTGIGGPLFDMGGAKSTAREQTAAYSRSGASQYLKAQKITVTEGSTTAKTLYDAIKVILGGEPKGTVTNARYCDLQSRLPIKTWTDLDFFDIFDHKNPGSNELITMTLKDSNNQNPKTDTRDSGRCEETSAGIPAVAPLPAIGATFGWGYKQKFDYQFKTIDTKVYNVSPTTGEIAQMSIATPDLPINSRRFVTFLGVGGDTVSLDYPNFYDVPVYTGDASTQTLLSPQQIEANIRSYLHDKITDYNTALTTELQKKDAFYNTNKSAYDFAAAVDSLATPQRSYTLLPTDFFDTMLSDESVRIIAYNLYWQNALWQQKTSSTHPLEDIANLQKEADLNAKIKDTMSTYLTQDLPADLDNPLITPGYKEKGYEVAYINSNGLDYINADGDADLPAAVQRVSDSASAFDANNKGATSVPTTPQDAYADSLDKKCHYRESSGVPLVQLGKGPISPWADAFKCWFNQTLALPLTGWLSLDYHNAQGPVFQIPGTEKLFPANMQDLLKYTNNQGIFPAGRNQRTAAPNPALAQVMNAVVTDLDTRSVALDSLDGLPPQATLTITATQDVGALSFSIASTGDVCLSVDGKNTCSADAVATFNPYSNPQTFSITSANKKVGAGALDITICQGQTCDTREEMIETMPGSPYSAAIYTPTKRVLYGAQIPVVFGADDRYGNALGLIPQSFDFTASAGTWGSASLSTDPYEFDDFSDAQGIWQAPMTGSQTHQSVTLELQPQAGALYSATLPSAATTIDVVQGALAVSYSNQAVQDITYTLPGTQAGLVSLDANEVPQFDPSGVPYITIRLTESGTNVGINAPVTVTSANDLLKVGTVTTASIPSPLDAAKSVTQTSFAENTLFSTDADGTLKVYLLPSFEAGTDTIRVAVQGLKEVQIPVTILPAEASVVELDTATKKIDQDQNFNATLSVRDKRGNKVTSPQQVKLATVGALRLGTGLNTMTVTTTSGETTVPLASTNGGGKSFVVATLANLDLGVQKASSIGVTVQQPFIPTSGLNVMWLNWVGNDRGNARGYFSDNANKIPSMIASSKRLLTVTTELTDPQNLKPINVIIGSDLRVTNNANVPMMASFDHGKLMIDAKDMAQLDAGNLSDYSYKWLQNQSSLSGLDFSTNTIVYLNAPVDDRITTNVMTNKSILINGDEVLNFADGTIDASITIQKSDTDLEGISTWDVMQDGVRVGQLLMHRADDELLTTHQSVLRSDLGIEPAFVDGSTNGTRGLAIYSQGSTFADSNKSYLGLQDASDNPDEGIGFRGDYKAVSNFAAGQSVGQATEGFGSEFLINYGDPLLTKTTDNTLVDSTDYDQGIGTPVTSNPEKTIAQVLDIDYNADGLQDMITIYQDGGVELFKNYGGSKGLVDMWPLMQLSVGLSKAEVWDVDGNGYPDLILHLTNNQLRVYYNRQGMFDVDGHPVCLDVPNGPMQMDGVVEEFTKDMDNDGKMDIVTNDIHGQVKIFYGGTTNGWSNYVSNDLTGCDAGRYDRQKNSELLVKQFGAQINPNIVVKDNSLVRRQGLHDLSQDQTTIPTADNPLSTTYMPAITANAGKSVSSPMNFADLMPDLTKLDYNSLVNDGAASKRKYVVWPTFQPVYDPYISTDNIRYIPLQFLESGDALDVSKTYIDLNNGVLEPGDVVNVRVTMTAKAAGYYTYVDDIKWPRSIDRNDDNSIASFDDTQLPAGVQYQRKLDDYAYAIDNIHLTAGQKISFGYSLTYVGGNMVNIHVDTYEDANHHKDALNDIKVYPIDGCTKVLRNFINEAIGNNRSYSGQLVDYGVEEDSYTSAMTANSNAAMTGLMSQLATLMSGQDMSQLSNVPGLQGLKKFDPQSLLKQLTSNGGINLNLNTDTLLSNLGIKKYVDKTNKVVDNSLKGLCQGFKLDAKWCTSGLPMPFNMAFLSPGTFNIMWCRLADDPGLPIFFFPGTLQTPAGPVPFPYGQKGPGDTFLRAPGGVYPSQIRIYASPTLTMGMGLAICLGPMGVATKLPQPLRDIGGNCIVLGASLPKSCKNSDTIGLSADQTASSALMDSAQGNRCDNPPAQSSDGSLASPFIFVGQGESSKAGQVQVSTNPTNQYKTLLNPGMYGPIQLTMTPVDQSLNKTRAGNVQLKGGNAIKLKIQGGGPAKSIASCIIKDWLEKQVKYFLNNMSSMTVTLYLPDVTQLVDGMNQLGSGMDQLTTLPAIPLGANQATQTGRGVVDQLSIDKLQTFSQSYIVNQKNLQNISNSIGNPFDAILTMFKSVPLIKISTQTVPVQIPMIYAEDITRYSALMQTWLTTNRQILQLWLKTIADALWACSGQRRNQTQSFSDYVKLQVALIKSSFGSLPNQLAAQKQLESLKLQLQKAQLDPTTNPATIVMLQKQIKDAGDKQSLGAQCTSLAGSAWSLNQIISLNTYTEGIMTIIRQNIQVLQQYKQFPFQLYERVHVTDRYLSEVSSIAYGFTSQITTWLTTNSHRFSQYVDVLILMVGVIKTWQAILDISVRRKEQCGKCKNDNYDYYSCSLSLLCKAFSLPVLPIPPFKIPNIYLDLSHINLGIHIVLPQFSFVPTSIPLPQIPNIPAPPPVNIDVGVDAAASAAALIAKLNVYLQKSLGLEHLPSAPVIPAPPQLPPLPSFIPSLNITLPVLPPAPAIPELFPQIKGILKGLGIVTKILCIVKWSVGLVGENGVKSKIEQLTQRTRQIPGFDYLNTTINQTPLVGFDFRLDAYVDLQFNFDVVSNFFGELASRLNQWTKKTILNPVDKGINDVSTSVNQSNFIQGIDNVSTQNINFNGVITASGSAPAAPKPGGMNTTQPAWDYDVAFKELNRQLSSVLMTYPNDPRLTEAQSAQHLLNMDTTVAANYAGITAIGDETQQIISKKRTEIQKIAEQIKTDYKGFVRSLDTANLVSNESTDKQLSANLFNVNPELEAQLSGMDSPMRTYTKMNRTLVDGFNHALATNTPASLGVDQGQFDSYVRTFHEADKNLTNAEQALDVVENKTTPQTAKSPETHTSESTTPIRPLAALIQKIGQKIASTQSADFTPLAQTQVGAGSACAAGCSVDTPRPQWGMVPDLGAFVNGIMVQENTGTDYASVMISDKNAQNIGNQRYQTDLNKDGIKDIVLRDDKTVYVKYGKDNPVFSTPTTKTYDEYYLVDAPTPDDLAQTQNNGYVTADAYDSMGKRIGGETLTLKVRDRDRAVANFLMAGQTFETIALKWDNRNKNDANLGYILKMNQRVDTYADAYADRRPTGPVLASDLAEKYVLVLPQGADTGSALLDLQNDLNTSTVSSLYTGKIIQILTYDPSVSDIKATLSEIPRNREYIKIAKLAADPYKGSLVKWTKISPWSNQLVAGRQLIGDDKPPVPTVSLTRVATNDVVSDGTSLKGFVQTQYNLNVKWTDNVWVDSNWFEYSGQRLETLSGDSLTVTGLFFTGTSLQNFTLGAIDVNGNDATQDVTLQIDTPSIQVSDIPYVSADWGQIVGTLDQDVDTGTVIFQKLTPGVGRKNLTGINQGVPQTRRSVSPNQTVITGGLYDVSDAVGLYLADGTQFGSVDSTDGAITIAPSYQDRMPLRISFGQGVPVVIIHDNQTQKDIFSLALSPEALWATPTILSDDYKEIPLNSQFMGNFAGGRCVQQGTSECQLYVSPQGSVYVPQPYNAQLKGSYGFGGGNVLYTVSDAQGTPIVTIPIKIHGFLQK